MKTKCILFDADGIIINSEKFSIQYQKEFGVSNDEMLPFFNGEFQKCLVGKADLKELVEPWLSKWKWDGTVEEFLEFWFKAEHKIDEEVAEIIEKLKKKGVKCFLATNQEKYRTKYMKKDMGFEGLFDYVFSSAEIGFKKPQKEFYEKVLKELKKKYGIETDEIIFFDDSQGHINEAKKLGIDGRLYKGVEILLNL